MVVPYHGYLESGFPRTEAISRAKLNWDVKPGDISAIFEANDGAAMEQHLIETNEKLKRVYSALQYLTEFRQHTRGAEIKDILNPPDPTHFGNEAIYPAGG